MDTKRALKEENNHLRGRWSYSHVLFTWSGIFWDVKGVDWLGELGDVVVDIADSDVYPHVRGLQAVVGTDQQGVLGAALAVQALGGCQLPRLRVNVEAVICPADNGVCDQGIGSLRQNRSGQITLFCQENHIVTCGKARIIPVTVLGDYFSEWFPLINSLPAQSLLQSRSKDTYAHRFYLSHAKDDITQILFAPLFIKGFHPIDTKKLCYLF